MTRQKNEIFLYENSFLGTCKIYEEGDSMMKCLARQQLECFYSKHYGCNYKCITNRYRGVFDMYPNTTLQTCKSEPAGTCNFDAMTMCYFSKNTTKNCLDPCDIEIYAENSFVMERKNDKQNMTLMLKYESITHCWKDYSEKKNDQLTSQIQIMKILY